jgi:geranylgeranyl diphosphate synthase type I
MDFVEFVKAEKQKTDQQLTVSLKRFIQASRQIDPEYGEFARAITDLATRGGKRLRPLLVRLSHDLVAEENPGFDLVQASIYVELLHLFMLVHDDIADRDLRRYGGPTLEVVFQDRLQSRLGKTDKHFGTSLALIAGDLLHVLGNGVMIDADIPETVRLQTLRHMQRVLHQVIAGWHIHFWQNQIPLVEASSERYLKGMELVSASYTVQGPLELGLILAEKQVEFSKPLNQLGYHVGMAFQIQDDILGVFGDPKVTGKPAGNDIREGKKTLLVLEAYDKASIAEKKVLEQIVGDPDISQKQLDSVKEIITTSQAFEHSKSQAHQHIENAIKILDSLKGVNSKPQQRLKELAEFMVSRQY